MLNRWRQIYVTKSLRWNERMNHLRACLACELSPQWTAWRRVRLRVCGRPPALAWSLSQSPRGSPSHGTWSRRRDATRHDTTRNNTTQHDTTRQDTLWSLLSNTKHHREQQMMSSNQLQVNAQYSLIGKSAQGKYTEEFNFTEGWKRVYSFKGFHAELRREIRKEGRTNGIRKERKKTKYLRSKESSSWWTNVGVKFVIFLCEI